MRYSDEKRQLFYDEIMANKFENMSAQLGVAHICFRPQDMTFDLVGGRDKHHEVGRDLKDFGDIVHPDDKEKLLDFFKVAAADTAHKHNTLARIYSKKIDEHRQFSFSLAPITDDNDNFRFFSGYAVDITERLNEMQKRNEATIRILRQEKNSAVKYKDQMNQMLFVMGHDLRTPLNAIQGFGELMRDAETQADRNEYFDYLKMAIDQMSLLVNDILESTRLHTGRISYNIDNCCAKAVLDEVYAAHSLMYRDLPCELVLQMPENDFTIRTDKMRLVEILNNYLSNAAKYTYSGTVTLSFEEKEDGGCFHVVDTGVGIEKEDCEKVFNCYEMLDTKVSGTGLGLYICRELAKGLNGRVGCISEKGKGSDFWVWMPKG